MSSPAAPAVPPAPPPHPEREMRVHGHATLFYFWPIWLVGYLFCLVSMFGEGRTAVLSKDAAYIKGAEGEVIKLPKGKDNKPLVLSAQYEEIDGVNHFYERMSPSKSMGV